MKSKGQWLPRFIKMCSHLHAAMQITFLIFSHIYYGKSSTTCTYASMIPAFSFLRTRQTTGTFVNSFNCFQPAATASNFLFTCLLLHCTKELTGCDCLQLPATTLVCLLLMCALILTGSNWLQLLSACCKSLHLLAVKTVH